MQHLDEGRLQEWLDRDRSGMSDGEQEAVARHLAECAACADRAEALAALTDRTRSLLATARPADPRTRVATRGSSAPPFTSVRARARTVERGQRRHRRWRAGAWAASVVLAVAAGWSANELTRGAPSATLLSSPSGVRQEVSPGGVTPRTAGEAPPAVVAERPEARAGAARGPAPSARADAGRPVVPRSEPPTATSAPPTAAAGQPAAVVAAPTEPTVSPGQPTAASAGAGESPPAVVAERPEARAGAAPADVVVDTEVRPTVVSGRVTDAAGAPIEAAQVYVPDADIGVLTQADGTFLLMLGGAAPAPGGSLTLTVERIGYGAETRAVVADGGATLSADFELAEQALALDEIVVTGAAGTTRRRSLGNSVSTLTVAEPGEPATIGSPIWTRVEPDAVAAELGFAPRSLPTRPVDQVAVATLPDGTPVARTLQTLEDGTPVTLYESPDPIRLDPASVEDGHSVATSARGDRTLIATGPLTVEALGALLARVR